MYTAAYSNDGKRIITGGVSGTLWDAKSGEELVTLHGHSDSISTAMFSPDDQCVLTSSWDGTIRVWNASSGSQLAAGKAHQNLVNAARFSANGNRIVSVGNDGTVRIWSLRRTESVWGIVVLPELWLTIGFTLLLVWSGFKVDGVKSPVAAPKV